MSWSGFKKSINRAGTGIMMKTGQVERTVDPEFADEESKYRQLEKEAASLQKETKAYLDSMRGELCSGCRSPDSMMWAWMN